MNNKKKLLSLECTKLYIFKIIFFIIVIAKISLAYALDENVEEKILASDQEHGLSLNHVMRQAFEYDKSLAIERENVKLARNNLRQIYTEFTPRATASQSKGHDETQYRGNIGTSKVSDFSTIKTLDVNIPIFNGFSSFYGYKRELENFKAAKSRLKAKEQETLLAAVQAYMNVVQEFQLLQLLKEKQKILQKYYNDTNYKFKLGEVTITDLSQANSRLLDVNVILMQQQAKLDYSKYAYKKVIGSFPKNLQIQNKDPLPKNITQEQVLEWAFNYNPTIILAKYDLASSSYDIASKYGALLPSLSLDASKNWRQGGYLGTGFDHYSEKKLMLNATIPLFDGGGSYLNIERARINKDRARYSLDEQQNIIMQATIESFLQYKTALDSIKSNQENVTIAAKAVMGVKKELEFGNRTTLELLNQEEELYNAKVALLRSQHDQIIWAYNLMSYIGKLTIN